MASSLPENGVSESQLPGDHSAASLRERTARFADTALPIALGIFIFTTPFAKVAASIVHSLCIILYFLRLSVKRNQRMVPAAKTYYIVLASYCGILILSIAYTPDFSNGVHEVWRQITRLSTVLILIETVQTGKLARTYLLAFITGTAVLAVIGLGEAIFLHARRPPTMWHPVHGANILLMGWTCALVLATNGDRRRLFGLFTAGLTLLAIYQTETRGVWVSMAAVLIMLPLLLPSIAPRYKAGLVAFVLLSLVLFSRTPLVSERIQQTLSDIRTYRVEGVSTPALSFAERLDMWKASIIMFRERPLVGIGAGGWRKALEPIVDAGEAPRSILVYGNPHNMFFNALSTRGIIGLVALCVFLGFPVYIAATTAVPQEQRIHITLLLCATSAFVVSGLSDTVLIIRGVFPSYSICIGLSLAALFRSSKEGGFPYALQA